MEVLVLVPLLLTDIRRELLVVRGPYCAHVDDTLLPGWLATKDKRCAGWLCCETKRPAFSAL